MRFPLPLVSALRVFREMVRIRMFCCGMPTSRCTRQRSEEKAGRKIFFNSLDDGHFPELSAKNTMQLIEEDKVFALFGYYGEASLNAALPILTKARVPLIGPLTGAASFREPVHPYVFNVR